MEIKLTGWAEGMKKISLTKLQVKYFGMSLKEAKTNVDQLLDGHEIIIHVDSNEKAQDFIEEARKIGVYCNISITR